MRSKPHTVTSSLNFYEEDWDRHNDTILKEVEQLGYPVIVKPSSLGSSIGVRKVDGQSALIKAVETAFRYDAQVLIEEAIAPLIEINCAVLGTPESCISSVCEQPIGSDEALSFADKYQRGGGGEKRNGVGRSYNSCRYTGRIKPAYTGFVRANI